MLFCTVLLAAVASAQISEPEARALARRSVQSRTGLEVWSVYRRQDVEDKLRSLAPPSKQNPLFVFALSDDGYEFRESSVARHISSEGPTYWHVAVSPTSGEVFDMDSRGGLNKLASDLRLAISDDLEAMEYLDVYLDLHPERRILDDVVRTPLQLKQTAEEQFVRAYDDFATAEAAFSRWWNQHGEALSRAPLKETFTKTSSGFLAKLYLVSGCSKDKPRNGPGLIEVSLPISREGQIGEMTFAPIKSD